MKKSDWALTGLATLALLFSLFAFVKRNNTPSQMEMKEELQVMAIIRESDCVSCIEKVLCYWQAIETDFASDKIRTRIIFCRQSAEFKANELEYLCDPPEALEIIDHTDINKAHYMPLSTPAVLVTNGRQSLYLEPVFLDTKMTDVHEHIRRAIGLFLPKTT